MKLFSPPVFSDKEKSRLARLLHIFLLTAVAITVTATLLLWLNEPDIPQFAFSGLGALGVEVLFLLLVHRGFVRQSAHLFVGAAWLLLAFSALAFGGLRGTSFTALVITILLAGVLLSGRAAVVTAVLSILLGIFLHVAEQNGYTLVNADIRPQNDLLSGHIAIFMLAACLLYLAVDDLKKALNRAQENEQALAAVIQETTGALTTALSLDQIIDTVLLLLARVISYDSVALFLIEADKLQIMAARGFPDGDATIGRKFDLESGVFAEIGRNRQPLLLEDAQKDDRFARWGGYDYIRGWLGVPLLAHNELIGYLSIDSREAGAYTQADAEMAQSFANQAAIAIENARLFENERHQRLRAQKLQETGSLVASSLELDEVLKTIAHQVLELLDVSFCVIRLLEPPNRLVCHTAVGVERGEGFARDEVVGKGYSGRVAQSLHPLAVVDMRAQATHLDVIEHYQLESFLGVPMAVKNFLIGVVSVYTQRPRVFKADELDLLFSFAKQAAIAVENARLFNRIQTHAHSLEAVVTMRTRALTLANQKLQQEIGEREHAERMLQAYTRELEKRNQQLQDFAYIASHDLQEPLRKIQTFSDRLMSRYHADFDERGQLYLERMQSSAARMQKLIIDLLTYSRVSTGARPFTEIDLNQVVQEVLASLEAQIERVGGTVTVQPLPTITGDALQIHQLFQNLISNGLKFHKPAVPPQIHIQAETEPAANPTLKIHVRDNGIGFEQKYANRIFEMFQRLHGRTDYEGTGMGLAICRRIVEQHQGQITVQSMPDEGSTFTITLPLHPTTNTKEETDAVKPIKTSS